MNNKVALIILDGWGLAPIKEGNATFLANTPTLFKVYGNYPKMSLAATGNEVGLLAGEMGNSEVGHLNIGSGRVVWEMKPQIDNSIKSGDFFEKAVLRQAADFVKKTGGRLQLVGLASSGGVHSHINHLQSLIDFAVGENLKSVYLHLSTDGRDTDPKQALLFINQIEKKLWKTKIVKISTIIGRYFSMDRDNNWQRTEKAYNLMVKGLGNKYQDSSQAIEANYNLGKGDEYIEPSVIDKNGLIKSGDAIIFFNFREDRSRQLLVAFESDNFTEFTRDKIDNIFIAAMTKYFDQQISAPIFSPSILTNVLADVIEKAGLRQYHTAETEKYAHVTYFLNGGSHKVHQFEKQILVPSPKVATYDLKPEMSASAVSKKVAEAMHQQHDFIVVNFANGDMVGHSGNLQATIKAVETIDNCLKEVFTVGNQFGYQILITADHGNCEIMINPTTGQPYTEHTTSPVPLCFLDLKSQPFSLSLKDKFDKDQLIVYSGQSPQGVLADISPTIIDLLGLKEPEEMSGGSLLGDLQV